eukprot:1316182-Amorphochlora_amoeboformis.AAC.1
MMFTLALRKKKGENLMVRERDSLTSAPGTPILIYQKYIRHIVHTLTIEIAELGGGTSTA